MVYAGKTAFSFFNKSNHIIFMKMARKKLHNSLKTIGLDLQLFVIDCRPYLFSHIQILPGFLYCNTRESGTLVKYLLFCTQTVNRFKPVYCITNGGIQKEPPRKINY